MERLGGVGEGGGVGEEYILDVMCYRALEQDHFIG